MRADGHQCETSWRAVADQMREHASTRSGQRRTTQSSWVRQVAQALEEQLKEDQQELETREQQRKVEGA